MFSKRKKWRKKLEKLHYSKPSKEESILQTFGVLSPAAKREDVKEMEKLGIVSFLLNVIPIFLKLINQ
jgi:hypothetical protein